MEVVEYIDSTYEEMLDKLTDHMLYMEKLYPSKYSNQDSTCMIKENYHWIFKYLIEKLCTETWIHDSGETRATWCVLMILRLIGSITGTEKKLPKDFPTYLVLLGKEMIALLYKMDNDDEQIATLDGVDKLFSQNLDIPMYVADPYLIYHVREMISKMVQHEKENVRQKYRKKCI